MVHVLLVQKTRGDKRRRAGHARKAVNEHVLIPTPSFQDQTDAQVKVRPKVRVGQVFNFHQNIIDAIVTSMLCNGLTHTNDETNAKRIIQVLALRALKAGEEQLRGDH